MKVWWLVVLTAVYSPLCSQLAQAWGPGVDHDLVGTSMQVGSNFFIQTLSATRHFSVKNEPPNSYFLLQERPDLNEKTRQSENMDDALMNLSWFLGLAYYRSSGQDPVSGTKVYDDAPALKIGVNWELGERANIVTSGGYQWLDAENYSQGFFQFGFTYVIPLDRGPSEPDADDDAEQFYLAKQQERDQPRFAAKHRYPNIRLGIWANYMQHTKSPTTSGRTAGSTLPGDVILNQSSSGPEVVLNLSHRLNFGFKALFYFYDSDIASFLSNTTIGSIRPKADLAIADLEDFTPILLLFPTESFMGSASLRVGSGMNLRGEVSYSTFAPTSVVGPGILKNTLSVGGILDFTLAKRWKIGAVLDNTVGGNGYNVTVGGFTLGYAL